MKRYERDEVLVAQFKKGDERAFDYLYKRYAGELGYFARLLVGEREPAQEIVDDAFLKLWKARAGIDISRTALYRNVRWGCLDYFKQKRKLAGEQMQFLDTVERDAQPVSEHLEHLMDKAEMFKLLHEEITRLPPQMRATIQLSLQELSLTEISEMLHCTKKTVLNQRLKAIRRLKEILGGLCLLSCFFFFKKKLIFCGTFLKFCRLYCTEAGSAVLRNRLPTYCMCMNDDFKIIAPLIFKHLGGTLSETEQQRLYGWIASSEKNHLLFKEVTDKQEFTEAMQDFDEARLAERNQKLKQVIHAETPEMEIRDIPTMWRWKYVAAAAVTLLVLTGSYFFWLYKPRGQREMAGNITNSKQIGGTASRNSDVNVIRPGGHKAVLSLADNSTIELQDTQNRELPQQGGARLFSRNSWVVYQLEGPAASVKPMYEPLYNKVTTPGDGQFQVELPDGSKVWLNASSSVRFPVVFASHERRVVVTGEAYFEVVKNTASPFIVQADHGVEVTVLGTHFNVKTYEDEPLIRTTLLEGAVAIKNGRKTAVLRPGYDALTTNNKKIQVVPTEDSAKIIAWKNGQFYFANENIKPVMRKIARWYNVDVEYKGDLSWVKFAGGFSRYLHIGEVLNILNAAKLRVSLADKIITVEPR